MIAINLSITYNKRGLRNILGQNRGLCLLGFFNFQLIFFRWLLDISLVDGHYSGKSNNVGTAFDIKPVFFIMFLNWLASK